VSETRTFVEQRDADRTEMLAQARAAVAAGQDTVAVDSATLVGLFVDLDGYRQREAEATRARVRTVTCMYCGAPTPVGSACPRCGSR
jgi:hypothetical protein